MIERTTFVVDIETKMWSVCSPRDIIILIIIIIIIILINMIHITFCHSRRSQASWQRPGYEYLLLDIFLLIYNWISRLGAGLWDSAKNDSLRARVKPRTLRYINERFLRLLQEENQREGLGWQRSMMMTMTTRTTTRRRTMMMMVMMIMTIPSWNWWWLR